MTTPTTPMPTPSVRSDVAAFVAAVRAQLDDLSSEEVTELTGGLEADLTDELADAGQTPHERYGDPVEYARELRSAAGLPPRGRGRPGLPTRFASLLADVQAQPWWPAVRDFFVALRPVWWVLRAWILVEAFLGIFLGHSGGLFVGDEVGFLLVLAAIVVSVEVGRRLHTFGRRQRTTTTVVNVLAVLALLPVLWQTTASSGYDAGSGYVDQTPPGLSYNGAAVSNVFPYDAQGRPLEGVQLYDQQGQALEIGEADRTQFDTNGNELRLLPGTAAGMPQRWNVFPLREQQMGTATDIDGNPVPGPTRAAQAPFAAVPPLLAAPAASAGATPTATATPTVTATATASPTVTK